MRTVKRGFKPPLSPNFSSFWLMTTNFGTFQWNICNFSFRIIWKFFRNLVNRKCTTYNLVWVVKGEGFCNFKSYLQGNNTGSGVCLILGSVLKLCVRIILTPIFSSLQFCGLIGLYLKRPSVVTNTPNNRPTHILPWDTDLLIFRLWQSQLSRNESHRFVFWHQQWILKLLWLQWAIKAGWCHYQYW